MDTNLWYAHNLLRSINGKALLHILYRHEGIIALPEVVEKEIYKVVFEEQKEAVDQIKSKYSKINSILGYNLSYSLPKNDVINKSIQKRITEELNNYIKRFDINLEHTHSALERVYDKSPPNSEKEQFRDSLIWEVALEFGKTYEVHFITSDKAFFKNKELNELKKELYNECKRKNIKLKIYHNLEECLKELKTDVPNIDKQKIAKNLFNELFNFSNYIKNRLVSILELSNFRINLYYTDSPNILAINFQLDVKGENISTEEIRNDILINFRGNCGYDFDNNNIYQLNLDEIYYTWTDEVGNRISKKDVFLKSKI